MSKESESKPNFLFIITHDTGDLFDFHRKGVETPNLNQLAENGIVFTNHFCTAPQCSPSRGSILTGQMPHSNGLMGLTNYGWNLESELTIPKVLAKNGYSTHLIGLQHEHENASELGYQNISNRNIMPWIDNVTPQVVEFLTSTNQGNIQQPFYCAIGLFDTHRPFTFPDDIPPISIKDVQIPEYLPDTPEVRSDISDLLSSIITVDRGIGRIVETLRKCSFYENTVVIFTVDHGPALPRAKCTLYDPGIRTALIINWPRKIKGGKTHRELLSNIDIFPTILDLCGISIPEQIQGQSFRNLLLNEKYDEQKYIFAELTYHDIGYNPIRAIRTKEWKYIKNFAPLDFLFEIPDDVIESPTTKAWLSEHPEYHSPRPMEELYDLINDPMEQNNLAEESQYQTTKLELEKELMNWLKLTNDPILNGNK
ncbi:MAG: sulfatase [Candidatus Heimdallarchaeota archaeon]|nr:MAG: sulfatase [Candidatus Heimdallarchaeota archaeon]